MGQRRRERSLAGTYLSQAAEHLRRTGSPEALYPPFYLNAKNPNEVQVAFASTLARSRQLDDCRASVLFSALAAEAYVNEFLAVYLKRQDYQAVERMSTVNKYVIGTRIAAGRAMFKRTSEPAKSIKSLFQLRHRLVHPQPGYGPPALTEIGRHADPEYNPARAAAYLIYVASAAVVLVEEAFPEVPDVPAHMLWHGRGAIFAHVETVLQAGLPDRHAEPVDDLVSQAIRAVSSSADSAASGDDADTGDR